MANIKRYLLSTAFIFTAAALYAQSGGSVAVPFLKMDMGARYYGMAGAGTAFADDVTGMTFYNPAALGAVQSFQVSGTTYKNALDMKHTYAGAAFPIPFLSFTKNKPVSFGFSFFMFDKGVIMENSVERTIGDDFAFAVSLGENVATHTWDLFGDTAEANHYVGATAKYIRSTLPLPGSGEVMGTAYAFDAGYRMTLDNRFGIGIAVRNLGTKIKYVNESNPLPTTLSAGVFLALMDTQMVRWDVSSDYIHHLSEKANRIRFGTEMVFFNTLAVRGGIKFMEDIRDEYTLGFGLRLLGFEVDFGTVLNPSLNSDIVYQAGISYKFPVRKEEDRYNENRRKRAEYQEYKEERERVSQESAQRNTSPILYQ